MHFKIGSGPTVWGFSRIHGVHCTISIANAFASNLLLVTFKRNKIIININIV